MTGSFESPASTQGSSPTTSDVAKEEARGVADDAKLRGQDVVQTARTEAGEVVAEAKSQARSLFSQLRSEVTDQSSTQNQRAAGGLHTLAGELGAMAQNGQNGVATDLVRQASSRLDEAAGWLESREPAEILDEVRRFARRRPGAFLAGAAAVGFLGGRLTRALGGDDGAQTAPGGQTVRRAELHAPTANEYDVVEDYRPDTVHDARSAREEYRPGVPSTAADSLDPVDPLADLSGPGYRPGERA